MTRQHHSSRNSRVEGAALVTALLAAVAITLLMFALTSVRVSEIRAISSNTQLTQAQMAAEAGIESIIALIVKNGAAPTSTLEGTVANATFAADATTSADPETGEPIVTVVSRGEYGSGVRTIEAQLEAVWANRILEEYALLVCHDLEITGSANVFGGDIYSGGNLTISKTSGLVNGDARAYGNVLLRQELAVTGNVISKTGWIDGTNAGNKVVASGYAARPLTAPSLMASEVGTGVVSDDASLYGIPDYCLDETLRQDVEISDEFFEAALAHATDEFTYLSGPVDSSTLPSPLEDGATYYVDGDLTLNADLQANATFVVTGDLSINGTVTIEGSDSAVDEDTSELAFVVGGDVSTANGNATINGVLYSNGSLDIANGSLEVNGSAVLAGTGAESSLSGNFTINYVASGDTGVPNLELVDVETARWRLISN